MCITENEDNHKWQYDHPDTEVTTTTTNDLIMVTTKPAHSTESSWMPASSEAVVKNKELDDWVPASKPTRVTDQKLAALENEDESMCH